MSRLALVVGAIAVAIAFVWRAGPDNPILPLLLLGGAALFIIGGVAEGLAFVRRKREGGQ